MSFIFTITNNLTVSASVLAPGEKPDVEVIELLQARNFTKFYGGCTFMTAPGITLSAEANTEMIKAEKTKLWARLRIIFSV